MSEGGGLLGDYYTPHYEAPLGIEWHGERAREGGQAPPPARRVLSSLVDMKSERNELIKNHGCGSAAATKFVAREKDGRTS